MNTKWRTITVLLGAALILGICGCGEKRVPVQGKVHKNGKVIPVTVKEGQQIGQISIEFQQMDNDKVLNSHPAAVNYADGTFTVPGPYGDGIPAGKYRITVAWHNDGPLGPDSLKGAFDESKTKINREVNGKDEININVANPPTGEDKK